MAYRWILFVVALFAGAGCLVPPATAQMWEQPLPDDFDDVWQPAPAPPGAVPWSVLTDIEVEQALIDTYYHFKPTFTPEVKALDGSKVKLNGYMIPLDPDEMQSHFLLVPYSHSCPFHMPAGPGGFVEIQADFPVEFSYEPVLIEGHFQILTDFSNGVFYKISAAQQVTQTE